MTTAYLRNPENLPKLIELTKRICAGSPLHPAHVSCTETASGELVRITAIGYPRQDGEVEVIGSLVTEEFKDWTPEMITQLCDWMLRNKPSPELRIELDDLDDFFKVKFNRKPSR